MAVEQRSTVPGVVLTGVGVVLILVAIVWLSIVGYYRDQLPVVLVVLAVGAGSAWYGQRIHQAAKRENALRDIARRDSGTV